jgi:hypothetical protein
MLCLNVVARSLRFRNGMRHKFDYDMTGHKQGNQNSLKPWPTAKDRRREIQETSLFVREK